MKTALFFATLDNEGRAKAVLPEFGDAAYENFMCAAYMRELLAVLETDYVCWSPRFDRLFEVIQNGGPVQFEEIGSTLYSTIDKFDKLNGGKPLDIEYVGVEVSSLLIGAATALHRNARLQHFTQWQDIPPSRRMIVSRSYQSSSYAFKSTEELYAWISRSSFGIHGIRWAIDDHIGFVHGDYWHALFDPEAFAAMAQSDGLRCSVISADTSHHGSVPFATAWLCVSRLDEQHDIPAICPLSRAALAAMPDEGKTAKWIYFEGKAPFDFYSPQLASQFGL